MSAPGRLFVLRAADVTDAEYFHHSWLASFRGHPLKNRLGPSVMADLSANVVLPMIQAADFRVACSPTESAFILGWAAVYRDTLQYVCVRQRYQRVGVATALVRAAKASGYVIPPPEPEQYSLIRGLEFRPLRGIVTG